MVTALMFSTPLLTIIHAHDPLTDENDLKQRQPSNEFEIVIPGWVMETDEPPKSEEADAVADAKRDVKAHVNKTLWFTAGCFFPLIGPAFSQRNEKSIPPARMLGKSPQYVAFYTDTYKIEMKKQRYTWALTGCILGGLTDACLVGILINRYNK